MINNLHRLAITLAAVAVAAGLGWATRGRATEDARTAANEVDAIASLESSTPPARDRVIPRSFAKAMPAANDVDGRMDRTLAALRHGQPPQELFEAQRRDDAWATPVESFFTAEIGRFFAVVMPEAKDLDVECRESMCLMQFTVPKAREKIAYGRQQALPLGESLRPFHESIDEEHARVGMYVTFSAATRPYDAIVDSYRELYAGRFPMPLEELPALFEADEKVRDATP